MSSDDIYYLVQQRDNSYALFHCIGDDMDFTGEPIVSGLDLEAGIRRCHQEHPTEYGCDVIFYDDKEGVPPEDSDRGVQRDNLVELRVYGPRRELVHQQLTQIRGGGLRWQTPIELPAYSTIEVVDVTPEGEA